MQVIREKYSTLDCESFVMDGFKIPTQRLGDNKLKMPTITDGCMVTLLAAFPLYSKWINGCSIALVYNLALGMTVFLPRIAKYMIS